MQKDVVQAFFGGTVFLTEWLQVQKKVQCSIQWLQVKKKKRERGREIEVTGSSAITEKGLCP